MTTSLARPSVRPATGRGRPVAAVAPARLAVRHAPGRHGGNRS